MFFEKELLSFRLLDVLTLKQKNACSTNRGRNFNALSFRYHSDACLKTAKETYQMRDHTVAYVPARLDYSRVATEEDLIVVHFETTDYQTGRIECFVPRDAAVFARLFREIFECWSRRETGYRYRCSALFYTILAECYAQNYKPVPDNDKIARAVEYLVQHHAEGDLTIRAAAQQSFISEVYFRKLFREQYGVSPQKYLVSLRIQHAAGLIATGYYTLQEVAALCGYRDYKYFSVQFKKMRGVSPSAYCYNFPAARS